MSFYPVAGAAIRPSALQIPFLALCLLANPSLTSAANVFMDGKEWRQLTETTGFSWDQIHIGDDPTSPGDEGGVCPTDGSACSGKVGSVDFTGWHWASASEVGVLFSAYFGSAPTSLFNVVVQDGSASATSFMSDFTVTAGPLDAHYWVWGWSATHNTYPLGAFAPYVHKINDRSNFATDVDHNSTVGVDERGVWLYKVTPIPVPSALIFLLSSLLAVTPISLRMESGNGP